MLISATYTGHVLQFVIIYMYTTRYSTIDELTTEQPQQNHTQSSHLAAKLIIEYSIIEYYLNLSELFSLKKLN